MEWDKMHPWGKKKYRKGKESVSAGTRLRNGAREEYRSWRQWGGEETHLEPICWPYTTHTRVHDSFSFPEVWSTRSVGAILLRGSFSPTYHTGGVPSFSLYKGDGRDLLGQIVPHPSTVGMWQLPSFTGSPVMAVVLVGAEFQTKVTPLRNCGAQADWGDDF